MSKKREDKEFTNNYFKPFTAKNDKQKLLFNYLNSYQIIIAHGSAGTGKTACVVSKACEELYHNRINKIIVSRPAVEAGETLGFIPGELIEGKFQPYLAPVRFIMNQVLGKSVVDAYIKSGKIEPIPLAYCRGHTFDNSFIILDEAQNSTPEQMKMFLTRIGQGSIVAITGDSAQSDIKGVNGLVDALNRHSWVPSVTTIRFNLEDIVRNSIVSDILSGYDTY